MPGCSQRLHHVWLGPVKSLLMDLSCHNLKPDFSFRVYGPAKANISILHPTLRTRLPCISGPWFICLSVGGFCYYYCLGVCWVLVFCLLVSLTFLFAFGFFLFEHLFCFLQCWENNWVAPSKCSTTKLQPQPVPLCSSISLHGSTGNGKAAFISLRFLEWTSDSGLVTSFVPLRSRFTYSSLPSLTQCWMKQEYWILLKAIVHPLSAPFTDS